MNKFCKEMGKGICEMEKAVVVGEVIDASRALQYARVMFNALAAGDTDELPRVRRPRGPNKPREEKAKDGPEKPEKPKKAGKSKDKSYVRNPQTGELERKEDGGPQL